MIFRNPLSLLAIAMVAICATTAQAQVDVQLNLRYTDPADETVGGTWDLLVQSGATNGLAGLRVVLDGITGVTGVDTPLAAITPNSSVFDNLTSVFRFQPFGGGTAVEIVAGDDFIDALLMGVGTGTGSLGNVAEDDLFDDGIPDNNPWDNSALIASGTFLATRPTFLEVDPTNGNLLPTSGIRALANEFNAAGTDAVTATVGLTNVRGDGVAFDGLLPGDANRSGNVSVNPDGFILVGNIGSGTTWDQGDFNSSGTVSVNPDGFLLVGNVGGSTTPPPLSAFSVPEPSGAVLCLLCVAGLAGARRRKVR